MTDEWIKLKGRYVTARILKSEVLAYTSHSYNESGEDAQYRSLYVWLRGGNQYGIEVVGDKSLLEEMDKVFMKELE